MLRNVAPYESFARFYDALMGDARPKSARVLDVIARHLPKASSLLELGCGTGAVLAGLTALPFVTGVDCSAEMLAIAGEKLQAVRFVLADMTAFDLGERFDVVICVFDTLNHLATFDAWLSMFQRVDEHLVEDGLFIFDVNTIGQLRRLGAAPPWVHDFNGNTLIMDVEFATDGVSVWDIRVFEAIKDGRFCLHHERISELGVPLSRIKAALATRFELLEAVDPDGNDPTDESKKAYFVYRRRTSSPARQRG